MVVWHWLCGTGHGCVALAMVVWHWLGRNRFCFRILEAKVNMCVVFLPFYLQVLWSSQES